MDEELVLSAYEGSENIYNGDLFIKRRYDVYPERSLEKEEKRLEEMINQSGALNYTMKDVVYKSMTFGDFCNTRGLSQGKIIDALERLRELKEKRNNEMRFGIYDDGTKDYSGTEDFWSYGFLTGGPLDGQFSLKLMNDLNSNSTKYYYRMQTLNHEFISLVDFLNNAKYIGRYFKRTKAGVGIGFRYFKEDRRCLVLYMYDNIAICRKLYDDLTGDYVDKYEILSCKYLEDGNYDFYGDVIESFDDKQAVYQEIYNQVYNHSPSKNAKSRIR